MRNRAAALDPNVLMPPSVSGERDGDAERGRERRSAVSTTTTDTAVRARVREGGIYKWGKGCGFHLLGGQESFFSAAATVKGKRLIKIKRRRTN